jgi:hypothetical protein
MACLKDALVISILLHGHDTSMFNLRCQMADLYTKQGLQDRAADVMRGMMGVRAKLG